METTFVAVRVRPLRSDEASSSSKACAAALDAGRVMACRDERKGGAYLRSQQSFETSYQFDASFGPEATQQHVYEATTRAAVLELAAGRVPAVSVIAYGATGAGKTHTMLGEGSLRSGGETARGESRQAGIIPRAVRDVFQANVSAATVSYLEVYNEKVFDLLSLDDGWEKHPLRVCEDDKNGVVKVLGLTEVPVRSANDVLAALKRGNARRTTEATGANDVSSRSHALLQLSIRFGTAPPSTLCLVDLAGSERASATGNRGARLAEAAHINKSLLALANCINALTDKDAPKAKFRDSKLTLLLKTALESPAVRLVVLACVSPNMAFVDDTFNTLKYAHRAKELPSLRDDHLPSPPDSTAASRRVFPPPAPPPTDADPTPKQHPPRRVFPPPAPPQDSEPAPPPKAVVVPRRAVATPLEAGLAALDPPPKPARRLSVAAKAPSRRSRRGSVPPVESGGATSMALDELRKASSNAVAAARAAVADSALVRRQLRRDVVVADDSDEPATVNSSPLESSQDDSDSPPRHDANLRLDIDRLHAALAETQARADRWRETARDMRELSDALAAACRACVNAPDDVGSLRARWEQGGLKADVDAARARWDRAVIDDDNRNNKTKPLADHNRAPAALVAKRPLNDSAGPPSAVLQDSSTDAGSSPSKRSRSSSN